MSKRFTATEKWDDPWFFELDGMGKLSWLYLLDKCDHAGIYDVNKRLMEVYLGVVPDLSWFKGRVVELKPGRWFIPKFIEFQYGNLNPDNRVHKSILDRVKKEGLSKGLIRGLIAPMEMEMVMDMEKDKNISPVSKEKGKQRNFQKPTPDEVSKYADEITFVLNGQAFVDFYESKGWRIGNQPMKDWKAAVRTWKRRKQDEQYQKTNQRNNIESQSDAGSKFEGLSRKIEV